MQLWLIPILPLLGFLANGLFGRRIPKAFINIIAVGSVALSFAWVVKTLLALDPIDTKYVEHYFTWIQSGMLNIGVDFAVDRLTAIMLMVVTERTRCLAKNGSRNNSTERRYSACVVGLQRTGTYWFRKRSPSSFIFVDCRS